MQINERMVRDLVSLGYLARENGLEVEDVVEMVQKGFVAVGPKIQTTLA